jgi:phosphopantetheine adenylyltransferase
VELASYRISPLAILDIVIPCPSLNGQLEKPRSQIFKKVQHIWAEVYSIVSAICARKNIELDGPGGIDVRVLLTDYDEARKNDVNFSNFMSGPIVTFETFAHSKRKWEHIFRVGGGDGTQVYERYLSATGGKSPATGKLHDAPAAAKAPTTETPNFATESRSAKVHRVVAVGGTFDHLHAGHKLLLTATALMLQPSSTEAPLDRRLIVGITGDELLKNKKYAEQLEDWDQREQAVINFLVPILSFTSATETEQVKRVIRDEPVVNGKGVDTTLVNARITIECSIIQDPFGPTITDESVSCLVVSGETRDGGAAVNTERRKKGWSDLEVFEIDVLDADSDASTKVADNFAAKISSTAIRKKRADNARKPSPSL